MKIPIRKFALYRFDSFAGDLKIPSSEVPCQFLRVPQLTILIHFVSIRRALPSQIGQVRGMATEKQSKFEWFFP
jgi:hypothetical protein